MRNSRHGRRVRALLTPLVTHADLDTNAPPRDIWRLGTFWKAMMNAARH